MESPSSFSAEGAPKTTPLHGGSSDPNGELNISTRTVASLESPSSLPNIRSSTVAAWKGGAPSLGIAVIGATGELARNKIFPALFALYYSGFLPEVDFVDSFVGITMFNQLICSHFFNLYEGECFTFYLLLDFYKVYLLETLNVLCVSPTKRENGSWIFLHNIEARHET